MNSGDGHHWRAITGKLVPSKPIKASSAPAEARNPPQERPRSMLRAPQPTPRTDEKKPEIKKERKTRGLLSTSEAAHYLGISIPTIRKYRNKGRIPFITVGDKLIKYDPADLDAFTHRRNGNPKDAA